MTEAKSNVGNDHNTTAMVSGVDTANIHPAVNAVVSSVYSSPYIAPQHAATVAAQILDSLASYTPAILTVTRADERTSLWAGIGIGLLTNIIAALFPHPKISQ